MRRALLFAAVVATCAGCGVKKEVVIRHPATTPASSGFLVKPPTKAPTFLLADETGKRVGPQLDRGHWTVVTFMYTNCPDVCPLVAAQLGAAQRQNADLRVIAVSVDPARDTAAARRKFLAAHKLGPRFHFVSGTRAALTPVWLGYHVGVQAGAQRTVSHSTFEILIDPQGREREYFDAQITARSVAEAVKTLT
jgi:protein SCO1/2